MWTADNRPRYNRDKLRYPSDLTDAEWAHIEPLIPPGKPLARRQAGDGAFAIQRLTVHPIGSLDVILERAPAARWRALPNKDLPPRSTVHDYLGL